MARVLGISLGDRAVHALDARGVVRHWRRLPRRSRRGRRHRPHRGAQHRWMGHLADDLHTRNSDDGRVAHGARRLRHEGRQRVVREPHHTRWVLPSLNTPPTVSLTSPANGATYLVATTIPLAMTASDADGQCPQVSTTARRSSESTLPPYVVVTDVPIGTR